MRRIKKIETESCLTPKQTILLWFQEAHAFNTIEEYVSYLKTQPDSAAPIDRLTSQVYESVKQTLGRRSREEINKAVNQGYKDVLFLFYLHQQVNGKLLSENRYYWTKWLMLSKELQSLLREREQNRRMRWNRIRVEMEMPYPLDAETATAIEAAKKHHVITWDVLEEGDDLGEWVRETFAAEGKTLLPDGAYLMKSRTKSSYTAVPTEEEVRDLFQDPESYQKFLDGEDYSNGLADVPDAEYDEHYEAIVTAVKDVVQPGTVIELPTVPHQFLREAPLVDGDWIDGYTVALAEWGARLIEKGFTLEESEDSHPVAWQRIIDPVSGSEADVTITMKSWQQTEKHLRSFPGHIRAIDERQYLSFKDYLKWKGSRASGLKPETHAGLAVFPWNQWVEAQGGELVATLAGVKVGELSCYLDGYRYRVCRTSSELVDELSQRESLLKSLQVGKKDGSADRRFRLRVEHWKESALGFIPEIYTLRRAINSISQRYFDGQEALFPEVAEGFGQLLALVEKLVGIFNEALAEDIERLERMLSETVDGQDESSLTLDLAGLVENVQGAAREQVVYMVDMAKADALELLGETRGALELVDRHI